MGAIIATTPERRSGKRRGALLIGGIGCLLCGLAAFGAWQMGLLERLRVALDPAVPRQAEPARLPRVTGIVFVDMPDMIVNLAADEGRLRYMKLRFSLQLDDPTDAEATKAMTPKILDAVQLYLRALKVEEVAGSQGLQRLKEELKARVNLVIAPVRIEDVLFKELLVQ
jgi:flagellar FliL protein